MMVDCLLIVIDEMSGQSYADLNRLKALTSTGVIYLRRPYGHYAETPDTPRLLRRHGERLAIAAGR